MPDEEAIILPYPKFEGVCLEYKQERHAKKKIIVTTAIAAVFLMKTFQTSDWFNRKAVLSAAKFDTSYQTRIFKARSQQERDLLKQLRLAHVEKQRNESINYYSHREAAISSSDHILSIKRDGMDQSKTNVPLYARRTSDCTIGIRLVGVKVHGKGDYVYLVDSTVCGGANLMIEILRLTVLHLQNNNTLPTKKPILYLQLENCSENKNKVLFGFLPCH